MEINMQIWILTFRVYGDLKGQKCLKNKPKITDFLPKSMESNLVALHCTNRSPMVSFDKNAGNFYVCNKCFALFWWVKLSLFWWVKLSQRKFGQK